MAVLFAKFEERSCSIDGSPTPLLGASTSAQSHWDQTCLSVTISLSASPPLPIFLWKQPQKSLISQFSQPQHSRLVAFSHPFPAVYPSTVALPEVNLWTANAEFSMYIFSPDRYWSKCSASFYPEPKTMAPPVALKARGSVSTTHLL